jgi:hypothetical protein
MPVVAFLVLNPGSMRNLAFAAIACFALPACLLPAGPAGDGIADDTGDDGGGGGDDGGGDDEPPPPPPPPPPGPAEVYHLTSELDVSASTVLPEPLYNAVQLMRAFATSPGETLLDAAELAGVPAIDEIRSALPDVLESRLVGWIDDRLEGTVFVTASGRIADLAEMALGKVELGSTLDLAAGVHALDTIAIEAAGHRVEMTVESPTGDVLGLAADVETVQSGAAIAIGEHRFGLRVGTVAWAAITDAFTAEFGGEPTTVISAAVDCPGIAHYIANKCVLGQCVGHEAQLLEVCEGAVGYAVDKIRDRVLAYDFDAVIFHSGAATGTDADGDLVYEALAGTWSAELDLGAGPRPVPATFTGVAE